MSLNNALYGRFTASNIGIESRKKMRKVANLAAKPFLVETSQWRKFDDTFCR